MKKFMDEDFLLDNEIAINLYKVAKEMPIIDYHCHLEARDIYEDLKFDSITQLWLGGDHYKWRLMRANGIEEKYITGEASDLEKFKAWAKTLAKAIGNPLYHFSHLELQRYFDIAEPLTENNAEEIFNKCNQRFMAYSARKLIIDSKVRLLCTTDDPTSDLHYHELLKDSDFETVVLPAFRPDKALNISKPGFKEYLLQLGEVGGREIKDLDSLKSVLKERITFFDQHGCRTADHGLDYVAYNPGTEAEVDIILKKALNGETISIIENDKYIHHLMLFLADEYHKLGWVMQLHYGCLRNNNVEMFKKLGPDTGFDAINTETSSAKLLAFLGSIKQLPKTILYSLNPTDNASIVTAIACFQNNECKAKMQQGSAWWFNDTKQGIIDQLSTLAAGGLLANFVGMLTDSRSFISYARHEYFRRILCNLIGTWVNNGEYSNDQEMLETIIKDICFENVKSYFGFDEYL